MNAKVAFCALMVAAAAAAPQPAAAQYYRYPGGYYGYGAASPYAISAMLRAHGLRQITQPIQTGAYVVVRAVDQTGEVMRVLINAHYGNIIQVTPLPPAPVLGRPAYGPPPGAYPPPPAPRYGDTRPDLKVEPEPAGPPGPSEPYSGSNALEQRAAVTPPPPPRTPMPRPRPAIAAAKTAAAATAKSEAVKPPSATPAPPAATTGAAANTQAFPPPAALE